MDKIMVKQNSSLKKLLTPEQFALHLKIYEETIGSAIKYRLEEY